MKEVEKHYTVDEVAELLGVVPRTVKRFIQRGQQTAGREGIYPVVRLSQTLLRIPASVVNQFLSSRTC